VQEKRRRRVAVNEKWSVELFLTYNWLIGMIHSYEDINYVCFDS
jgi:hypothetical protein